MDDVTWGALALTLTLLGAAYTWFAFRRRGTAAGLRGTAFTLLPLAAYLTGTLRMFTRMADAVVDWATSLVFNPLVWSGVVLAGVSAVLFVVSGIMASRGIGAARPAVVPSGRTKRLPAKGPAPQGAPATDDDGSMDEIEALLRKHGIS